jgi:hypothetical protein
MIVVSNFRKNGNFISTLVPGVSPGEEDELAVAVNGVVEHNLLLVRVDEVTYVHVLWL